MIRHVFFKEDTDAEKLAADFRAWLAQYPDCEILELRSTHIPVPGFETDTKYCYPYTVISIFAVVEV